MTETFDPYYRWLGIRDPQRPPNHYRLLGLEPFESDVDVIEASADRQMQFVRTFQTGPHADISQRILNELSQARLCLANPQKRAAYDEELRRATEARAAGSSGIRVAATKETPPEIAVSAPLAPAPGPPNDPEARARSLAKRRQLMKQVGLIWVAALTIVVLLLLLNRINWTIPDAPPGERKFIPVGKGEQTGDAASNGENSGEAVAVVPELKSLGTLAAHQISVWSLALSGNGETLLSGSADETARTWKTHNDKPDRLFDAHQAIVSAVAVSEDGQYAATADVEGQAYLWRLDRAEPLFEHQFSPSATVLAFAPDGLTLAAGLSDGTVALWNIGTGEIAASLPVQQGKIQALTWYDDERFLVGGQNPEVRLVQRDGKIEKTYPIVSGAVFALAAAPQTSRFFSGGQDGSVSEWALDATAPVRTLSGHIGPVRSLATTAEGRGLVSGGEDGSVRFWDLTTGAELARATGRTKLRVLAVAASPDGTRAWSAGTEPAIRAWSLPALPDAAAGR
ncbi:MAG TPA: WD40 repeat domain-containing protein [Pirellulales bacterium]